MTNNGTWNRRYHETRAIECANDATRRLRGYGPAGIIQANRLIAQARTHLTSIGPNDGKRTRQLWAMVCRADRAVARATEQMLAAE